MTEFYRVLEILGIDVELFQLKYKSKEVPNTIYCNSEFLDRYRYVIHQGNSILEIGKTCFHYIMTSNDEIVELIDVGNGAKVWFSYEKREPIRWMSKEKAVLQQKRFKSIEVKMNNDIFGIPFSGSPIEPNEMSKSIKPFPLDEERFYIEYQREEALYFLNKIENGHELIIQSPIFDYCLKMSIIHRKSLHWMIGEIVKENIALKKAIEGFLRK
ncbi:MAG: hypothetical protein AB8G11_02360 [Saprospiraceae bacterium]